MEDPTPCSGPVKAKSTPDRENPCGLWENSSHSPEKVHALCLCHPPTTTSPSLIPHPHCPQGPKDPRALPFTEPLVPPFGISAYHSRAAYLPCSTGSLETQPILPEKAPCAQFCTHNLDGSLLKGGYRLLLYFTETGLPRY